MLTSASMGYLVLLPFPKGGARRRGSGIPSPGPGGFRSPGERLGKRRSLPFPRALLLEPGVGDIGYGTQQVRCRAAAFPVLRIVDGEKVHGQRLITRGELSEKERKGPVKTFLVCAVDGDGKISLPIPPPGCLSARVRPLHAVEARDISIPEDIVRGTYPDAHG